MSGHGPEVEAHQSLPAADPGGGRGGAHCGWAPGAAAVPPLRLRRGRSRGPRPGRTSRSGCARRPGARRSIPGQKRRAGVLRFEGERLAGPAEAFSAAGPGGYLGPTFRVRRGQRLRVQFDNRLDEASIVHWHGLDVAEESDGHPRFAVEGGGRYRYDFTVQNRPGTYWYHPHPDGRTGYQVYAGMAGLFLVVDDDDAARGLPALEFDLPLVIQDRSVGADGELVYEPSTMLGFLGDRMFVNGRPEASFDVRAGSYRLRLVNGSNARIYKLAWSDGSPMTVIGSDGGLLGAPSTKPVRHARAGRAGRGLGRLRRARRAATTCGSRAARSPRPPA